MHGINYFTDLSCGEAHCPYIVTTQINVLIVSTSLCSISLKENDYALCLLGHFSLIVMFRL